MQQLIRVKYITWFLILFLCIYSELLQIYEIRIKICYIFLELSAIQYI